MLLFLLKSVYLLTEWIRRGSGLERWSSDSESHTNFTGCKRTVHTTLCLDQYSEQILVSCYDLEDGQCFLSVYLIFWT